MTNVAFMLEAAAIWQPQADDEEDSMTGTNSRDSEELAVEQELVILPDGRIEVAWITPGATPLVLEVFRAVAEEPFPVGVVSGNLYCG